MLYTVNSIISAWDMTDAKQICMSLLNLHNINVHVDVAFLETGTVLDSTPSWSLGIKLNQSVLAQINNQEILEYYSRC